MINIVLLFTLLVSLSLISGCGKPSDQKAYEEVVATMSMEKAKRFFDSYPKSRYRDRLVNEIIEWCKQEETKECYKLIVDTLPKDHPQYQGVVAYYESKFGEKK